MFIRKFESTMDGGGLGTPIAPSLGTVTGFTCKDDRLPSA